MTNGPSSPPERTSATILGIGGALPPQRITNEDLVARLDTTDDWIVRRTGVRERRFLAPGETLADLAAQASRAALADAGVEGAALDHVLVATFTPDRLTPDLHPRSRLGSAPTAPASSTSTLRARAGSMASNTPPP